MVLLRSLDEAKMNQVRKQKNDREGSSGVSAKTPFFGSRDRPDMPHAFLTRWEAARVSRPHFHENDQFQVVVDGKGMLGRHALAAYSVHFSRAYTPYGPLASGADSPMSFFVMRPRYDSGSRRLPRELEALKAVPDRRPFQITHTVNFTTSPATNGAPDVALEEVLELQGDDGLGAYTLTVKPRARTSSPDATKSGGQYLVIVLGSLVHNGVEYHAPALAFVPSTEQHFEICAGADGLQAIILAFPRR